MKNIVEIAIAETIKACELSGAKFSRVQVRTISGFGCMLVATFKQYEAWLVLMGQAGLEAEMHDYETQQESNMEPGYRYFMWVQVPDDWQAIT